MISPETALTVFQLIVFSVMIFGLLSLLTVMIPGLVIIWAAALIYGLSTGFNLVNGIAFAVITVLAIAGSIVDNILMGTGARQTGASWLSISLSLVAGLLGSFILPFIGGLLAALLTLFLVEWLRRRDPLGFLGHDWKGALQATRSMAVGCGWSVVLRLVIGAIMILLWVFWAMLWTPELI